VPDTELGIQVDCLAHSSIASVRTVGRRGASLPRKELKTGDSGSSCWAPAGFAPGFVRAAGPA
jgi:hypothetical protein